MQRRLLVLFPFSDHDRVPTIAFRARQRSLGECRSMGLVQDRKWSCGLCLLHEDRCLGAHRNDEQNHRTSFDGEEHRTATS